MAMAMKTVIETVAEEAAEEVAEEAAEEAAERKKRAPSTLRPTKAVTVISSWNFESSSSSGSCYLVRNSIRRKLYERRHGK